MPSDHLAIVWIDSHPDIGTPASQYPGFHAMAVAALTGHGDPHVQELLPAIVAPDWVALVGLHAWATDDIANVAHWGIRSFSPDDLRSSTQPLLDWLTATGCARVAVHFDVDTIDSNELVLGLGAEPGGLTTAQVRRIVDDIDAVADVVGITVAEFIPARSCSSSSSWPPFRCCGRPGQGRHQVMPARAATPPRPGPPRTKRHLVKRAEAQPPRPGARPVRSGSQLNRCGGQETAKDPGVPLRRVRAIERAAHGSMTTFGHR